jgi:hypothetical protein
MKKITPNKIFLFAGSLLTVAVLNAQPDPVRAAGTLPPGTVVQQPAEPATTTGNTLPNTQGTTTQQGKASVSYIVQATGEVLAREYLTGDIGTAIQFDTSFYTQPYKRLGYTILSDATVGGGNYQATPQLYYVLLKAPAGATPFHTQTTTTTEQPSQPATTPTLPTTEATTPATTKQPAAKASTPAKASSDDGKLFHQRTMSSVGRIAAKTPAKPAAKTKAAKPAASAAAQPATHHAKKATPKRHQRDEQQQYPTTQQAALASPSPQPGGGGAAGGNAVATGLGAFFVSLSGKIVFGVVEA